jgi:3-hydroxyacyl-CoA dehydrogenase
MRRIELEQKILDYIKTTYNAEYKGFLEVNQIDDMYNLALGIPSYMAKTYIGIAADNDISFLSYIYEELRKRNYIRQDVYKVIRTNEETES